MRNPILCGNRQSHRKTSCNPCCCLRNREKPSSNSLAMSSSYLKRWKVAWVCRRSGDEGKTPDVGRICQNSRWKKSLTGHQTKILDPRKSSARMEPSSHTILCFSKGCTSVKSDDSIIWRTKNLFRQMVQTSLRNMPDFRSFLGSRS